MVLFRVVVALLSVPAAVVFAQDPQVRVIVRYASDVQEDVITNAGGNVVLHLPEGRALAAIVPPGRVAEVQGDLNVLSVEPDGDAWTCVQTTPWGVSRVGADTVWGSTTGVGVRVAVVDTGIQSDHPDLSPRVTLGPTYVSGTKNSKDDNGHGTHVAGIVGATNNTIGTVGIAPGSSLLAVKVLDRNGRGYYSSIVAGIDYASDPARGAAHVINLSLGGTASSQALQDACDRAVYERGVVVVAAAGNDGAGSNAVNYPGAYASILCVAASDTNDLRASFSTYGPQVDVAAPGTSIYSTYTRNSYQTLSGTSMATPHVAGAAALLIASGLLADRSAIGTQGFGFINDEVRERLQSTATLYPTRTDALGYGRISASASFAAGPN